jgi:hypothetical protein
LIDETIDFTKLTDNERLGYTGEEMFYSSIKDVEGFKIKWVGRGWYARRLRHKYDFSVNGFKVDVKTKMGCYRISQYVSQSRHPYDAVVLFTNDGEHERRLDKKYLEDRGIRAFVVKLSEWEQEKTKRQLVEWLKQEFNKPRILKIWTEGIDWIRKKAKARFNKADNGNGSKFNKVSTDQNSTNSKTESMEYYCNTMSGKDKEDHKEEEDEVDHILYFGDNIPDECRCKVGEFNKTKHCVTCSPRCFMAWMLSSYCLSHKPLAKTTTGSGELL